MRKGNGVRDILILYSYHGGQHIITNMAAIITEDKLVIIQGRTKTSRNALYGGYRYSKDGIPLHSGYQSWRCIDREGCIGRIHMFSTNKAFSYNKLWRPPAANSLIPYLGVVMNL